MFRFERPCALMMPTVTEPRSSPSGLPIAMAQSPMRSWSESPSGSDGRSRPSILMMATSVSWSVPTTLALKVRLSLSVTVMASAFVTTWLFVRMCPSGSIRKPEPEEGSTRGREGRSWPKKRRNISSCGNAVTPDTFFFTSMKTTAGSVCSTTPTNGLSRELPPPAIAGRSRRWATESRCRLSPTLRPRPITSPARMRTAAVR